MNDDKNKLEPYQNQPLENLQTLEKQLVKLTNDEQYVPLWIDVLEARNIAIDMVANLKWHLIDSLIAAIEKAKWESAKVRSTAIFDIVECERLAWEIMADVYAPEIVEKPLSPYNDAAAPVKTEVRAVVSIACRQTYSSTAKQHFKFFTCVMENGEKVNVFNHPDESRNTFKIAKEKGWGHWLDAKVGENWKTGTHIPVTVSWDGEWYSLVDIIHRHLWVDLEFDAIESEPQDPYQSITPFEDGKWYHESPDDPESVKALRKAIDDIRQGIDLDDDDSTAYYIDGEPVSTDSDTPDESTE